MIYELNPADGSVRSSFDAPAAGHRGLAWDGTSLWYSAHGTRSIYQLDPTDGSILKQFAAPGGATGQPRGLAWDGTSLWHADASSPVRKIFRLSPVNGAVLQEFTSPVTLPVGLDYDGSHLWVTQISGNGSLVRFDTSGNVVQTHMSPGGMASGVTWDAGNGYLWVADYSPQTSGETDVLIRRLRVVLNP